MLQRPVPGHGLPAFDAGFRAELTTLFQLRRDVRRFRRDPVPPSLLQGLLDATSLAPSVGLSQPWRFVTVDDPLRRAAVRANFAACNAEALGRQPDDRAGCYARLKLAGLDDAPCHLAVCVEPDPAQGHGLGRQTMPETVAFSAVLAIHTLWLAARAHGLGLGWVSILEPADLMTALDVPASWRFVAYLCLGWPEEDSDIPELERSGWEQRRAGSVLRR
jgi:5,6-dimethylbenzimidazole synthase